MTNFVVENNCESLITNNPLSSTGTTLNVTTGEGLIFPSTFPYRLTIWDEINYPDPSDDSGMEIVECTGRIGDTLTIIRGKESTSGVSHTQDSCIAMLITAGLFNDPTYGILPRLSNKQLFTNLLENGDFESWSGGTSVAPDSWTLGGIGAAITRSTDEKIGDYSCQITSGAGDAYPDQELDELDYYKGRVVSFGCWVKSTDVSTARIYIYDGIGSSYSTYHTGGCSWEFLQVTTTISLSATTIMAKLRVNSSAKVAYFDGAILVEGSVCPAFSPKPMAQPSLITSAPSDTGYNGEIRIYSTGGIRRLYISDGSNWKYQAIAT